MSSEERKSIEEITAALNERVERKAAELAAAQASKPKKEPEDARSIGILDYATEDEWGELEEIAADREEAEAEAQRLTLKAADLERQASVAGQAAERVRVARRAALAAVALGEVAAVDVPESKAPAFGESSTDLQDAVTVLRDRAAEKRSEAEKLQGDLRARTIGLFKACAHRAAEDYLERARGLGQVHAAIGSVQELLDGLGNVRAGVTPEVLVDPTWFQVAVPSAEALAPLRGRGHDAWFKKMLVGGDEGVSRQAASAAYGRARSEVAERLGCWPLDKRRL